MFIRLLLFIPLLRSIMLCEELDEFGGPPEPDYAELDELAVLHARAILHLNELDWPGGRVYQIQVGEQLVETTSMRGWISRKHFEPVYSWVFGISAPGGIFIMRSGAIYGLDHYQGETLEHTGVHAGHARPLDPARMDEVVRRDVRHALLHLLNMEGAPTTS